MRRLPKAVFLLAMVSFFTDMSSEMIYPLLPVFLSSTLGVGALALGIIEGIAESTASLFKIFSGLWTDKTLRRKPLIVAGYGLAGFMRPLIGLATAWPFVMVLRFLDRIGKGLRTSPRDALIADVTDSGQRGYAFGFHRSMDHAGAVIGPIVSAALLGIGYLSLRHVFLLSLIPSVVVLVILIAGVKEPGRDRIAPITASASASKKGDMHELGSGFKRLLAAVLLFTLGNSTDAFIILRLSESGVPTAWIALLWSAHHVVKMTANLIGGRLADYLGFRGMIISGWILYSTIYLAFAFTNNPTILIIVFLVYGIYFGLVEPAEKAWVAELVPGHLRGTAFGYYHGVVGLGALPASILFGFLWHTYGVSSAFITGAALAAGASLLLILVPAKPEHEAVEPEISIFALQLAREESHQRELQETVSDREEISQSRKLDRC